jgi:hypothetical protein
MSCGDTAVVGEALEEVGDVDQDGAGAGCDGLEVTCVVGIDFEAANGVLEEEGAEAEVGVREDAGVAFLL